MLYRHIRAAITALVIVAGAALLAAGEAEARRRSFPVPLPPIPGLRSEVVVLVKELPRTEALRRADGRYIDLGFKFHSGTGGEWVGYLGSSSEYLPLDDRKLTVLMSIAGLAELPPEPSRPWSTAGLFWLAVIGVGALFAAGRFWRARRSTASASSQRITVPGPQRQADQHAPSEAMLSAEAAMDRAIREKGGVSDDNASPSPALPNRSSNPATPVPQRTGSAAARVSAGFGKPSAQSRPAQPGPAHALAPPDASAPPPRAMPRRPARAVADVAPRATFGLRRA
jgi:hypothetical protein